MNQSAFEKFLHDYTAAWNGGDFSAVLTLWDSEVEEPWHFPEELEQPLVGWGAIKQYLDEAQAAISQFSVKLSDAEIKPLTESYFVFRFAMQWKATLGEATVNNRPVGAKVRVSGVLRKTSDSLRLIHYMEAGPAAFPFIKKMYEQMAAED